MGYIIIIVFLIDFSKYVEPQLLVVSFFDIEYILTQILTMQYNSNVGSF